MSDTRLERVRARMIEHGVDVLVLRPSPAEAMLVAQRHGGGVVPALDRSVDARGKLRPGQRVVAGRELARDELLRLDVGRDLDAVATGAAAVAALMADLVVARGVRRGSSGRGAAACAAAYAAIADCLRRRRERQRACGRRRERCEFPVNA